MTDRQGRAATGSRRGPADATADAGADVAASDVRARTVSTLDRRTIRWLVLWGLTVWLAVAVAIRLVGHVLLSPANPLLVAGFFGSVVPLMALVTYPVYRRLGIRPAARPGAAAVLSLPGMVLDVGLVLAAGTVFPAMATGAVVNFGAILLFGYAVVLATGVVPGGR